MSNSTVIYGVFEKNLWRDEKNGNSVFRFKTKHPLFMECMYIGKEIKRNRVKDIDETWYTIIVNASKINIPSYQKGVPLKVDGCFSSPGPNLTWEFNAYETSEASNDEEISITYLSSETFPDISVEIAEKIVKSIGSDIHDFILTHTDACEILMNVTELDKETVLRVINTIEETYIEKTTFNFLAAADIPYPYCLKAIKLLGKNAVDKLKKSPYKEGRKIGLDFKKCDKLSKLLGGNGFDTGRLKYACLDVMDMFAAQGNIYTPLELFKKTIIKKLKNDIFNSNVSATNVVSVMSDQFALERIDGVTCIYSKKLLEAEKRVAKNISRLSCGKIEPYNDTLINYAETACSIKYGNQQRKAFPTALSKKGVKIITGGPGTGKTTTIKGILLAYQRMHPNHIIKLCAPTGRASQRMSESTGMPATTIHRLLDYKPYGDDVSYKNANDPIIADLIVVDEVSMCDILLFDMLLEAINTGTTLILVGDIHQLESVGPGAVLRDLLSAEEDLIQKCLLTDVFRQVGGSPIIDNAEKINCGITTLSECEDFKIFRTKSEEESLERIIDLCKEYYKSDKPFETQILCPSRSGMTGIDNLNTTLHDILNPGGKTLIYGKNNYRINDKILMTRNNFFVDYYNGDIGIIKDITESGLIVEIRDNEFALTRDMLDDITLSYGMTIHKSQGSEFVNVIVVMPMQPQNMLVRNLFYTGITRAKKKVFIINEGSAMQTAIKTDKSGCRRTLLKYYLPVETH